MNGLRVRARAARAIEVPRRLDAIERELRALSTRIEELALALAEQRERAGERDASLERLASGLDAAREELAESTAHLARALREQAS